MCFTASMTFEVVANWLRLKRWSVTGIRLPTGVDGEIWVKSPTMPPFPCGRSHNFPSRLLQGAAAW